MKKVFSKLLLWIFLVCTANINAQSMISEDEEVKCARLSHSIYAEVFGQGFSGSLNYDALFHRDRRWKKSITTGLVYAPSAMEFGDGAYLGIPVSFNFLIGGKRNFLELGLGFTAQLVNERFRNTLALYSYFTPKIGYRFQPLNRGIFFRATFTPHVALLNVRTNELMAGQSATMFQNVLNLDYPAFPWFGVSIGYTFSGKK